MMTPTNMWRNIIDIETNSLIYSMRCLRQFTRAVKQWRWKLKSFYLGKILKNYKNSKIIKTQKTEKSLKNRKQINKWNYKKKIPGSFQKTGKKQEKRHIWQSSRSNISTFANLYDNYNSYISDKYQGLLHCQIWMALFC